MNTWKLYFFSHSSWYCAYVYINSFESHCKTISLSALCFFNCRDVYPFKSEANVYMRKKKPETISYFFQMLMIYWFKCSSFLLAASILSHSALVSKCKIYACSDLCNFWTLQYTMPISLERFTSIGITVRDMVRAYIVHVSRLRSTLLYAWFIRLVSSVSVLYLAKEAIFRLSLFFI